MAETGIKITNKYRDNCEARSGPCPELHSDMNRDNLPFIFIPQAIIDDPALNLRVVSGISFQFTSNCGLFSSFKKLGGVISTSWVLKFDPPAGRDIEEGIKLCICRLGTSL